MNILEKRKSMPHHDFKVGDKCIVWYSYPYRCTVTKVVRETKRHWVLAEGTKCCKTTMNNSGFVGYSDAFVEPINKQNAAVILKRKLFDVIYHALEDAGVDQLIDVTELIEVDDTLDEDTAELLKAYNEG